jgi:hypothetical protein
MKPKMQVSKRSLSPRYPKSGQNQMSNTTENYYMKNMNGILPSTHSIETPGPNLARSMTQIRKESEKEPSRGRHVVGSERFDMRGKPSNKVNYQAQNPLSPFRGNSNENRFLRQGMTSTSTSTSLNKYSFRNSSKQNLDDSSNFYKKSFHEDANGNHRNPVSMQELQDLDVSPEKRYLSNLIEFQDQQNSKMQMG